MSKPFVKIKSSVLGFNDQITLGKYQGFQVSEVIDIEPEYLTYISSLGVLKLSPKVLDTITVLTLEKYHRSQQYYGDSSPLNFDDIPF